MVSPGLIDRAIDRLGETITVTVTSDYKYSEYGDESFSTSTSTQTLVHNDIIGDEEFNKEGIYRPGDKVFFAKSDNSLSVGDRITFSGNSYDIKDIVKHNIQGKNFVNEIRCSRVD